MIPGTRFTKRHPNYSTFVAGLARSIGRYHLMNPRGHRRTRKSAPRPERSGATANCIKGERSQYGSGMARIWQALVLNSNQSGRVTRGNTSLRNANRFTYPNPLSRLGMLVVISHPFNHLYLK